MQHLLNISAFGKLVGMDRKTLIFYDQTGILKPTVRTSNGYRYYTVAQVSELCIILTLQELGLSLKQIRAIKAKRSASLMEQLFRQQIPGLEGRIRRLASTMDMIRQRQSQLDALKRVEVKTVSLNNLEAQYYYRSELCDLDKTAGYNPVWERFYSTCEARHISQGYPVCYMLDKESLLNEDARRIHHIAFHVTEKTFANYIQPPGQYAVAWFHTASVSGEEYRVLLNFIENRKYVPAGGAIEEVLFDEVYVSDPESFITKVTIPVIPLIPSAHP